MTRTIFIAAALALAVTLPAIPAQATGVSRTFLSAAGSDSNNCANVLTPCRHLATAYAATAPNGEIYVLDPANYGSLTITGPISIEGHGWASIAPTAGNPAITINASSGDKINIVGVVLDGTGLAGTTGIQFNSGGSLNVRDSVIRNFSMDGINFTSTTSSKLSVSNTLVSDNTGNGIELNHNNNDAAMSGVLDHVALENNANNGLEANGNVGAVDVTVSDSVSVNNGTGILANATAAVYVVVRRCNVSHNGTGVGANNNFATVILSQSIITVNDVGWTTTGTGFPFVKTASDNLIDNNTSGNGTPSSITYK